MSAALSMFCARDFQYAGNGFFLVQHGARGKPATNQNLQPFCGAKKILQAVWLERL